MFWFVYTWSDGTYIHSECVENFDEMRETLRKYREAFGPCVKVWYRGMDRGEATQIKKVG
jgi:hypothetical protein